MTDNNKTIITESNFKSFFPQSHTAFKSLADGRFAPKRKMMKGDGTYNQVRYLEIEDIIHVGTKRMDTDGGYNRAKTKPKWEYIISTAKQLLSSHEEEKTA